MSFASFAYWPVVIGPASVLTGFGCKWISRRRAGERGFEAFADRRHDLRVREDVEAVGTHGIERHLRDLRRADLAGGDGLLRTGTRHFLRFGRLARVAKIGGP